MPYGNGPRRPRPWRVRWTYGSMTGRAPRHLRVLPAPGAHGPAHLHLPRVGDADHRRPVHRPDHAARPVELEPVHRGRGLPREPGAVSDRARVPRVDGAPRQTHARAGRRARKPLQGASVCLCLGDDRLDVAARDRLHADHRRVSAAQGAHPELRSDEAGRPRGAPRAARTPKSKIGTNRRITNPAATNNELRIFWQRVPSNEFAQLRVPSFARRISSNEFMMSLLPPIVCPCRFFN